MEEFTTDRKEDSKPEAVVESIDNSVPAKKERRKYTRKTVKPKLAPREGAGSALPEGNSQVLLNSLAKDNYLLSKDIQAVESTVEVMDKVLKRLIDDNATLKSERDHLGDLLKGANNRIIDLERDLSIMKMTLEAAMEDWPARKEREFKSMLGSVEPLRPPQ
jgi:hypothetical protein